MTIEAIKYGKDCKDFEVLKDGTITGDYRYCNLSNLCRQVDSKDGKPVGMLSHNLIVYGLNNEVLEHVCYCTGFHDLRPLNEKVEDDKVS